MRSWKIEKFTNRQKDDLKTDFLLTFSEPKAKQSEKYMIEHYIA